MEELRSAKYKFIFHIVSGLQTGA